MTRRRRWKTRHTVSLLALAAFTAALIAVRAAWLPPILNSGRHFGGDLSLASNRDHLCILLSKPAHGCPHVGCFPASLDSFFTSHILDTFESLVDTREMVRSRVQALASNDPNLSVFRSDLELADYHLQKLVGALCECTAYIPSEPMRFGFAFGKFQTATHASHLAYVSWYWIYAIPAAAPALVLSLASIRRLRSRRSPGHCLGCGYDLTANESGKCPECGISTSQSEPAAQARESPRRPPARAPQSK